MSLKLGNNAFLFDSDGKIVLVAKTIKHEAGNTGSMVSPFMPSVGLTINTGTVGTLPEGYVNLQFARAKNQGGTSAYAAGGSHPSLSPSNINVIDKWPFASDANATDVGDLNATKNSAAGVSSPDHGYVVGGNEPTRSNVLDRFAYASDGNATDHGDLASAVDDNVGSQDKAHGYTFGGRTPTPFPSPTADFDTVEKFPFANTNGGVEQGDLSIGQNNSTSQTSEENTYISSGRTGWAFPTFTINIRKAPFASLTSMAVTGVLTQQREDASGSQSTTHGYTHGGKPNPPPPAYSPNAIVADNVIDKFPFASDANATDVGDLYPNPRVGHKNTAGHSSTTHGYMSAGEYAYPNEIHKYTFAADNNSTDVGDMTVARGYMTGHQF